VGGIHPTAVIDPGAELGDGVTVGPYAVIGPEVRIGDGSEVMSGAQIEGPTVLGRDNVVFPHACIGLAPQDLKFAGERSELRIGDRNRFREFCTVHRGTAGGGGLTTIGDDNLFMVYSHVAHDCHVGSHTVFVNNATLGGHIEVGDWAVIGAFTSVHQFCRVGAHAYTGGYSVLTRDALPFVKTVGIKPACYGINRIGLERRGFTAASLRALEQAYRILVRSRQPLDKALAQLRQELADDPHVGLLIDFVSSSQRGVIREPPGGKKGGRGVP